MSRRSAMETSMYIRGVGFLLIASVHDLSYSLSISKKKFTPKYNRNKHHTDASSGLRPSTSETRQIYSTDLGESRLQGYPGDFNNAARAGSSTSRTFLCCYYVRLQIQVVLHCHCLVYLLLSRFFEFDRMPASALVSVRSSFISDFRIRLWDRPWRRCCRRSVAVSMTAVPPMYHKATISK